MKDIFKSLKLVKFSLNYKLSLIFGIMFTVLSLLFELVSCNLKMTMLSGMYIGIGGTFFANMFMLSDVPGYVRSSRFGYVSVTKTTTLFFLVYDAAVFTIYAILRLNVTMMLVEERPADFYLTNQSESYLFGMIRTALFLAFLMIYLAISYRRYWLSVGLMCIVVIGIMFFDVFDPAVKFESGFINGLKNATGSAFVPAILAICYGIIILGAVAFHFLNRALYRYEIEPVCYKNAIKQAYAQR